MIISERKSYISSENKLSIPHFLIKIELSSTKTDFLSYIPIIFLVLEKKKQQILYYIPLKTDKIEQYMNHG